MISDRIAILSNRDFTCTAPPSDHIPQLATGQGTIECTTCTNVKNILYPDTLETMISLTVRGTDVSIAELNMMFPFTDCAVHNGLSTHLHEQLEACIIISYVLLSQARKYILIAHANKCIQN